jgi:flagellar basal body-associated protein FliL
MRRRLKFIIPLALLIALGGVYKVVLAKSPTVKPKVDGQVYVLPKEFLLNLADNHFAKLDVALVLDPSMQLGAGGEGAAPPEGYGALPQEAAVRDVITDVVTDASSGDLIHRRAREGLKRAILKGIRQRTDVKVNDVLFTDVAVQ